MAADAYQATLDFLYAQLPMFQRVGAPAFKRDLTNTLVLLSLLDNPHQRFASIHIAGTNGKGSVTHLLSAALQAAGYRTGLYVSPHYRDFRERIRVNGEYVSKAFVVDFVERVRPYLDTIQPSFFELTVAMAFEYFAREGVQIAVVEVGLGGRLDSTNVLLPELSVITNISYDHQQFLGNTLPEIAGEKAGIIKKGVPVVVGETQAETTPVFTARAAGAGAPLYFADQQYRVETLGYDENHSFYRVKQDGELRFSELKVELHGPFQPLNLQTSLAALDTWRRHTGRALDDNAIVQGWADLRRLTKFQGRWQILGREPLILADSAHNEGGLRPVLAALQTLPHRRLHIVLGVVDDKDLDKMLPLFPRQAQYYFAKANIPRGLAAKTLADKAAEFDLAGAAHPSVPAALAAARAAADPDDLIFVGGSIFVVAEVLPGFEED